MPAFLHLRRRSDLLRRLFYAVAGRRFSQSTSIPKKLQRVRDHGFDNVMEVEKKVRRALSLQSMLLSQPSASVPFARLNALARRYLNFAPDEVGQFLIKHPYVFHVFDHPVQRLLWVRLTPRAETRLLQESDALLSMLPDAVRRLRKLLLLATPSLRVRLEHIRVARYDFGLPDDFEQSVVLAHPSFFRLVVSSDCPDDPRAKYVEFVGAPADAADLRVCAIERTREREYRERGTDAEDSRFAFLINFPPGFKIGKYYRVAVWKWQRLPYWSPYEDVSGYDLRSLEAQRRMEKRMVATIHELLSLTVEKRLTMERIAHFRQAIGLPKKMKEFLLQHQGIFYISTRGNQGKLHTVFLREAYRKGDLLKPNPLYLTRRKLGEMLIQSSKNADLDGMMTTLGRGRDGLGSRATGDLRGAADDSGSDSGVDSQFLD